MKRDFERLILFITATKEQFSRIPFADNVQFVQALCSLLQLWIATASKLNFFSLFKDPFKPCREATRVFLETWKYPASIKEQF